MHEISGEMELCQEWGEPKQRKGEFMSSSACMRRKSYTNYSTHFESIIGHRCLHCWPLRGLSAHVQSRRSPWPPGWRLVIIFSLKQISAPLCSCLYLCHEAPTGDKLPLPSLGSSCLQSQPHSWLEGAVNPWYIFLIVFPRLTYEGDKIILMFYR